MVESSETREDKQDVELDDSNQYEAYESILKQHGSHSELSFPISEKSIECKLFRAHRDAIVSKLNEERHLDWCSVECFGRVYSDRIRSAVVVTCRHRLERSQEKRLTKSLQHLFKNKEKESGAAGKELTDFPFEFIEGEIIEDHIDFKEKQDPLVCGASCSVYAGRSSGTFGGFITIDGDPDKGAVYAVTNHHVVATNRAAIPWMGCGSADTLLDWHTGVPEGLRRQGMTLPELLRDRQSLDPPTRRCALHPPPCVFPSQYYGDVNPPLAITATTAGPILQT